MDVNNCYHCTGRVGRDPELKVTPTGTVLCKFSLAVDHGWGDKKTTMWFNCTIFGKSAERAEKLLAKGKQIQVVGSLNLREYEKDGVKRQANDLDVDDFKMIGPREDAAPKPAPATQAGGYDEDDSIPF